VSPCSTNSNILLKVVSISSNLVDSIKSLLIESILVSFVTFVVFFPKSSAVAATSDKLPPSLLATNV